MGAQLGSSLTTEQGRDLIRLLQRRVSIRISRFAYRGRSHGPRAREIRKSLGVKRAWETVPTCHIIGLTTWSNLGANHANVRRMVQFLMALHAVRASLYDAILKIQW